MIYLVLISFGIYVIYNILSIFKSKENLSCLSDTYYIWPNWVFPLIMILISGTLLPAWLNLMEGSNFQFLAFISCASILFVGVASDYKKNDLDYKVHSISAYIACFTSMISISILLGHWYDPFIWILLGIVISISINGISQFKRMWLYVIETSLFVSVYFTLIIKFL